MLQVCCVLYQLTSMDWTKAVSGNWRIKVDVLSSTRVCVCFRCITCCMECGKPRSSGPCTLCFIDQVHKSWSRMYRNMDSLHDVKTLERHFDQRLDKASHSWCSHHSNVTWYVMQLVAGDAATVPSWNTTGKKVTVQSCDGGTGSTSQNITSCAEVVLPSLEADTVWVDICPLHIHPEVLTKRLTMIDVKFDMPIPFKAIVSQASISGLQVFGDWPPFYCYTLWRHSLFRFCPCCFGSFEILTMIQQMTAMPNLIFAYSLLKRSIVWVSIELILYTALAQIQQTPCFDPASKYLHWALCECTVLVTACTSTLPPSQSMNLSLLQLLVRSSPRDALQPKFWRSAGQFERLSHWPASLPDPLPPARATKWMGWNQVGAYFQLVGCVSCGQRKSCMVASVCRHMILSRICSCFYNWSDWERIAAKVFEYTATTQVSTPIHHTQFPIAGPEKIVGKSSMLVPSIPSWGWVITDSVGFEACIDRELIWGLQDIKVPCWFPDQVCVIALQNLPFIQPAQIL